MWIKIGQAPLISNSSSYRLSKDLIIYEVSQIADFVEALKWLIFSYQMKC